MTKPTYLETLRARSQRQWKCRLHNKVTSVKFSDSRCDACRRAESRRVVVLAWMKSNGAMV